MVVHFLLHNWYWVCAACISGGWLVLLSVEERGNGFSVTPAEAVALFNKNNALFFDLRDEKDRQVQGVIVQAKKVSLSDQEEQRREVKKAKNRPIILCCDNGRSSDVVARSLRKEGFEKIYALRGGFQAWQGAGFPITVPKQDE